MYMLNTDWRFELHDRLETQANHLSMSSDARHVVVTTTDKKMRVYEVDSLDLVRTITHGSTGIFVGGEYAPSGDVIACGPKKITLFDARTGKRGVALVGHRKEVSSICFMPDGETLWTGALARTGRKDDALRLWSASSGDCLWQGLPKEAITKMARSEGGELICVAGTHFFPDKLARLIALDTTTRQERWRIDLPGDHVFSLCISPVDGSIIAAHGEGQSIRALSWLDPDTGQIIWQKRIADACFMAIDASEEEAPVLLMLVNDGSDTLYLRAHDIQDGTTIATSARAEGMGYGFDLVVTPRGRVFAGTVGHVVVWDRDV